MTGVNILRYSQIKYLGKVSIFWYFGEEFPHFYQCFKTLFQILMKNANNFVESMIYALLLGKSFSLTFGKCFLGFHNIFTPDLHTCILAYLLIYLHTYIPVILHTCILAYVHTCICAYMHTCIRAYVHTCIRACMHACMHACIHACTHACMRAYYSSLLLIMCIQYY